MQALAALAAASQCITAKHRDEQHALFVEYSATAATLATQLDIVALGLQHVEQQLGEACLREFHTCPKIYLDLGQRSLFHWAQDEFIGMGFDDQDYELAVQYAWERRGPISFL